MDDISRIQSPLIQFLKDELDVPVSAIAFALRHVDHAYEFLPMVLWQYGMITTEQLDRVFAWMEAA
jgi:hypothetical protein